MDYRVNYDVLSGLFQQTLQKDAAEAVLSLDIFFKLQWDQHVKLNTCYSSVMNYA